MWLHIKIGLKLVTYEIGRLQVKPTMERRIDAIFLLLWKLRSLKTLLVATINPLTLCTVETTLTMSLKPHLMWSKGKKVSCYFLEWAEDIFLMGEILFAHQLQIIKSLILKQSKPHHTPTRGLWYDRMWNRWWTDQRKSLTDYVFTVWL